MAKKNFTDNFAQVEVSKNAMTLNANACRKKWWSDSDSAYNLAYIHYIEHWANEKIIVDGEVRLNEIREKFGLPPVPGDFDTPFKPEQDKSFVTFDTFIIDKRDTGNGEEYVVDIGLI